MTIRPGDSKEGFVASEKTGYRVSIVKNGPYLVSGKLPLKKEIIVSDRDGESVAWRDGEKYPAQKLYTLCRCGKSEIKPFCDGAHEKIGFDGAEVAARTNYSEQVATFDGPGLVLTDAENLCSEARFCHPGGGTWRLTRRSDDPDAKRQAIQEACDCPSGRLVIWDRETGQVMEPVFEPSISLVEDPPDKVSGPIWLKGGIPLQSSDGTSYETRNRVTLCRCGGSGNKPFCDGDHCSNGFNDGDESVNNKDGA